MLNPVQCVYPGCNYWPDTGVCDMQCDHSPGLMAPLATLAVPDAPAGGEEPRLSDDEVRAHIKDAESFTLTPIGTFCRLSMAIGTVLLREREENRRLLADADSVRMALVSHEEIESERAARLVAEKERDSWRLEAIDAVKSFDEMSQRLERMIQKGEGL